MTQNNSKPNPFAANNPPASSRFGASSNNSNKPTSRFSRSSSNSGSSRSSGLSRFGRESIHWTVMPLARAAVHITLSGLGDPFQRLLGKPLNAKMGSVRHVVAALQKDKALHDELEVVLDQVWQNYGFEGAALLFPWDDEVRKPYAHPIHPQLPQPQPQEDASDDDAEEETVEQFTLSTECLRAIDLAFVLNILGRARSNVVVANTPLALEPAFLQQDFICDDPRIVAIARATGAIEEQW